MAEEGTFIGEVQRGWQRFWMLSWWWKAPAIAFAVLVLLGTIGAIAGGGGETDDAKVGARTSAGPSRDATTTPKSAATPSPTLESVSTRTPVQTTPPPAPTEPPMEARVEKSYRDNQNFMIRASAEDISVQWLPEDGQLYVDVHPSTVLSEGDFMTIASQSALVASRAVWTTYPEVQRIDLTVFGQFIDQFGASEENPAVTIGVARSTGERFQYDGLRDRVYADNKHFLCVADSYFIHSAVYREIEEVGCLATWGPAKVLP